MDLHDIEMQLLQLLALVIASLTVYGVQRAASWMNLKLNADRVAAVESAVNKVMSKAVVESDSVIRAKGWDHIDTKNTVINAAIPALGIFFKGTLDRAGIDLKNPEDTLRIERIMERLWPDIATRLSASPATAPAAVVPAIVAPVVAPAVS